MWKCMSLVICATGPGRIQEGVLEAQPSTQARGGYRISERGGSGQLLSTKMWCFRVRARRFFPLYEVLGSPKRGGGGVLTPRTPPPLHPPLQAPNPRFCGPPKLHKEVGGNVVQMRVLVLYRPGPTHSLPRYSPHPATHTHPICQNPVSATVLHHH